MSVSFQGPSDECVEMVATAQEKKKMEVEVKRESLTPLQVIMTPTFYMVRIIFFVYSYLKSFDLFRIIEWKKNFFLFHNLTYKSEFYEKMQFYAISNIV